MKPFRVLVLCLAICLLAAFPDAKAEETITFSTHVKEDYESFAFMHAVMTEAFSRLGMKFVLKSFPGKRSLEMADSGSTDGESLRIAGLERKYPNLIQIPVALRTISSFAYSQQDLELPNGWEDLKNFRTVIIRGSVLVTDMAMQYGNRVEKVNTHAQQLRFLISKRADILIASPSLIDPLLELDEFKNQGVRKIYPALSTNKLYFYLHKSHKDLVAPFTLVLQEMLSDGTYHMIAKRFGRSAEE